MGNQLSERAPGGPFLPGLAQSLHIVVVGLDSSGKTSLLYRLKLGEFVETVPTKGFNMERVRLSGGGGGGLYQVWDVGGQDKQRPLWKAYARRTDGLVFVVDAADTERLEEARAELHRMARCPESQGAPILLLANKQDLPGAMTPAQVEKALSVHELSPSTLLHTQGCSALDGDGLQPGLDLLHDMILQQRRSQRQSRKKR
ncbi:ADP-ribosylation factor-like protein 4D [Periophthalmus magnuspinnatus]|uniref:ADP-ribosylation factor-like protein 4D n=1 Tax=Periophthalmus magnuspinnatus TaxID=409849 RepID=UPI00145B7BEE|nr:ADP-ribosylation factor-like protein 4D [Periophthalmus magnuspinnatus]